MRVIRKGSAFGPGDSVPVFVELRWSGNEPIRVSSKVASLPPLRELISCHFQLTRLDFILREQITFRYPSPNNSAYLVRSPSRTSSIFTINANTSSDSDASSPFAILYRGEPATFDLNGTVPTTHTRVTVRTAVSLSLPLCPNCDELTDRYLIRAETYRRRLSPQDPSHYRRRR